MDGDGQGERLETLLACLHHAGAKDRLADPLATMERCHGDAQLRRLLVDEPEPRLLLREHAVPGGTHGLAVDLGDDATVTVSPPIVVVATKRGLDQELLDRLPRPVGVPPGGLVQHRAEELRVVLGGGSDVHAA